MRSHVAAEREVDHRRLFFVIGIVEYGLDAEGHVVVRGSSGCHGDLGFGGNTVIGIVDLGERLITAVGHACRYFTPVASGHYAEGVCAVEVVAVLGVDHMELIGGEYLLHSLAGLCGAVVAEALYAWGAVGVLEIEMVGVETSIHDAGHHSASGVGTGQIGAGVDLVDAGDGTRSVKFGCDGFLEVDGADSGRCLEGREQRAVKLGYHGSSAGGAHDDTHGLEVGCG